MKSVGFEMLKSLGSGVLPPGVDARANAQSSAIDFRELLNRASSGAVESGIPVRIAPSSGVQLSEDQLKRLATAADKAEAAGASRAMVMIDGRMLRMDVHTRTVLDEVSPQQTGVFTDIDALIRLDPEKSGASVQVAMLTPPDRGVLGLSPSVLSALAATG